MSTTFPFRNVRDVVAKLAPPWLAEGPTDGEGSYGFRFLTVLGMLAADGILEAVVQGSLAAVGRATPTALPWIGQARGMIRNQDETDEAYADRLRTWIDRAKENGSTYRLALAIHDYLRSHPMIRVYRRDGSGFTVDTDRSITDFEESDWDWDSVSHPERNTVEAPWWSDLWMVIYTTSGSSEQYPLRPGQNEDLTGDDGFGLGQLVPHTDVDAVKGLVLLCKSAHTCIRAIVWTSDENRFDPDVDASQPDGTWGAWGMYSSGSYVASGRDLTTCRYWEPR